MAIKPEAGAIQGQSNYALSEKSPFEEKETVSLKKDGGSAS